MKTATFYPTYHYPDHGVAHYYYTALMSIRFGASIRTTQMCLLNKVKDYDLIRIVEGPDDVIEIVNNGDGSYSCDRTDRTLRRVNSFFHLWENGEFRRDGDGNDDNDSLDGCDYGHHRCDQHQVSYDELDNERHKAVCALRKVPDDIGKSELTYQEAEDMVYAALGVEKELIGYYKGLDALRDRLIHLLGGDQPMLSDLYGIWQDGEESENKDSESTNKMTKSAKTINLGDKSDGELMENGENHKFDGRITDELREMGNGHSRTCPKSDEEMSESAPSVSITDELRKWASDHTIKEMVLTTYPEQHGVHGILEQLIAIADRIDEQQEKVLQQTIDEMAEERDKAQMEVVELRKNRHELRLECGELQEKLDESTHDVEMWRDRAEDMRMKRDELQPKLDYYDKTHVELPKDENDEYIHIGDVMDGYGKTIEVVELRYGRSGWMLISRDGNGYADTFAFAHHHDPTVEQVIRDLTLGKITEAQAIERIEGINGQG